MPVLAALVAVAPVGLAPSAAKSVPKAGAPLLSDVARNAGCVLREFDTDPHSNPPVSGDVDDHARPRCEAFRLIRLVVHENRIDS